MISPSSIFASSAPATSRNVTFDDPSVSIFARLFPKENIPLGPPAPPCMRRMMISHTTRRRTQGSALTSALIHALSSFTMVNFTCFSFHCLITSLSRMGSVSENRVTLTSFPPRLTLVGSLSVPWKSKFVSSDFLTVASAIRPLSRKDSYSL